MKHNMSPDELVVLMGNLLKPTALIEGGVLAACLLLAWLITRVVHRQVAKPASIWMGDRVIDGVMFPAVALLLALASRSLLTGSVPLAVFRLAVPVLTSLMVIRLSARVLRVAFPNSQLVRIVERTISWGAWLAVVLWVTGVLPLLMDELDDINLMVGGARVSVSSMVNGALTAVIVLVAAFWLSAAIEARLLKGVTSDELSMRKIVANTSRAILVFAGLLLALKSAGIDLTALSVLGGAFGVGLGFGMQKLAANYVSGYMVLAERALRIGDMVKVDNFEGRITDIKTRYTVIRSTSGRESIVPNEMLISQRVENASLADPNLLLTTVVQVAYGTDIEALRPRVVEALVQVERVLTTPEPSVFLSAFASDGLELTVAFWIKDPERSQLAVRSDVNLAILRKFNELGIEIPFPQRVVRVAS